MVRWDWEYSFKRLCEKSESLLFNNYGYSAKKYLNALYLLED